MKLVEWLAIAAGGAAGSVLRAAVQRAVDQWPALGPFPAGTLTVNIAGCFLIGLLSALFLGPTPVREVTRLGLTVGLLGGFTTFSTFGLETLRLVHSGQMRLAVLYVAASFLGGLFAVAMGERLVGWLAPSR